MGGCLKQSLLLAPLHNPESPLRLVAGHIFSAFTTQRMWDRTRSVYPMSEIGGTAFSFTKCCTSYILYICKGIYITGTANPLSFLGRARSLATATVVEGIPVISDQFTTLHSERNSAPAVIMKREFDRRDVAGRRATGICAEVAYVNGTTVSDIGPSTRRRPNENESLSIQGYN